MQEVEKSLRLKQLCSQILENPKEWNGKIKDLQKLLTSLPPIIIQKNLTALLSVGYLILKDVSEGKDWYEAHLKV